MLTIEFNQLGESMPDHMVEDYVLYTMEKYNSGRITKISVSQELVVDAFKMLVAEGEIDCNEIQFLYRGEIITVNKYGTIANYPGKFCSTMLDFVTRNLDGARKQKRAK